jgi:two-component system CheB/CheR fusion protein
MLGFVVDALPHKVWISAADGIATYYNQGWYDYTGIRGFEQMKKQVWDVIHPEDREIAARLWPEAVATGHEFEVQQRLRRYDGQYRWHLTRASANKDTQGNILRWIGSCTDIHEQKLAQEALQVSESHFKTITQLNSLPIWRVDAKGDTVFINDTWKTFAGVDDEPGSNALWSSNIHPDDCDSALSTYKQQFELRQPFLMKYRFWYAPSGQYHWMLDHAQPVFNPGFDGYIGTMTDIEEQEQAKLAMQELMAKKDEFISIASHELRTPLTTIKAFFQLLERQHGLPEKPASLVKKTNKQINRLERLIKDLLDVSRINAGKMVYDLSWFELDEVVTDAVESIREHTSSHKIIVGAIPEVRLHADRHRIEQVLLNLLDNAIKYSPGQHEVKIECQQFPDHIRVSITDHGIGMNSDQTRRLFERFYRAENPGNVFQGLGLGLFISAEIVERHGGRFEVQSEPGDGSTFSFTLPISPGA